MKKLQLSLFILYIIALVSCGNSKQNTEKHTHSGDCIHAQTEDTSKINTEQEAFTVEADSMHVEESNNKHEHESNKDSHRHADGKVHNH